MILPFRQPITFFRGHIGTRIMAGFSLITLLALLVALVSLANVATVNGRLDESARRDRQAAANALRLQLAIEQQSDGVRGFLLSGDDRFLASFEAGATLFDETIAQLEAELPHPESADRLEEIRFLESRFREVARQQITLYRQDWPVSALYLWNISGRERQDEVQREIKEYAAWQEVVLEAELAAARARSTLATVVALALVALAGLVSTIVSVVLTRSITRPIRALARIAGIIKGGDLDVHVPAMGSDEIGTLAQTIDQMTASLKESRRSLEASLAETEVRNRELLALNTVAAAAVSFDRQQLLETTLETVLNLTGVESGSIHLLNDAGVLQPAAHLGFSASFLEHVPYDSLRGLLETVMLTGSAISFDDDSTEPVELLAMMRREGVRAAVAVPIRSQAAALGVLALGSQSGRRFGLYEIGLLTSIGSQIGVALENSMLLLQREQRITTLSVVNEVSRAISAVLDLDALYAVIYEQCRRTLDVPNFLIATWDDEDEALTPCLVSIDGQQRDAQAGWPYEPALLTHVARARTPLLTNDYQATCRALGIPPASHVPADERRSWLGVPMTIGDRLVGVILATTAATTYSEEDSDLLAAIANQAAVAMENASLYQQTRELGVIEERNRLAREIHDTIAQGLTGIVLQLEATSTLIDMKPERARQRLTKATELARSTLGEARRSVWNLRPAPLEERSLPEAIQAAARRLSDDGLRVETHTQGEPTTLAPEIENGLFRITQEALQNVRKHARAANVDVTLDWSDSHLTLTVQDDGQGFDPASLAGRRTDGGGFGLLGMRERARLVGGMLDIHSTPGAGTCLRVSVPLNGQTGIPKPTQPATPTSTRALIP